MHSALVLGTPIYEFGTKKKFYAQLDENFYEFEFASIEKHQGSRFSFKCEFIKAMSPLSWVN